MSYFLDEIISKLDQLEARLLNGLNSIQNLLINNNNSSLNIRQIEESVGTINKSLEYLHYTTNEEEPASSLSLSETQQKREIMENHEFIADSSTNKNANIYKTNSTTYTSQREIEILKFNNSLQITRHEKIYYYYWKIDTANNILFEDNGYLQSMDFYINGKKIAPNNYYE